MAFQIVVGVPSLFIIPQVFLDGLLAGVSQRIVLRSASAVPDALLARARVFSRWNIRALRSTGTIEVVRMVASCCGLSIQRELKSQPEAAAERRSR